MKAQLPERLAQLHKFILESFLSSGRSPTLTEIQSRFSLEDEAAADKLLAELEATRAIHRTAGDTAVTHAYPFSNEPTSHRVKLATGAEVFSMCAVDALGIPLMARQDAVISSECHNCGTPVRVDVRAGAIDSHKPEKLVVGYRLAGEGCISAVDLCPNVNFFCSAEHLQAWNGKNPERAAQVLDLASAFESGRHSFESLLYGK